MSRDSSSDITLKPLGRLSRTTFALFDTIMNIQMGNLAWARKNDAINALMKLRYNGVKENQIVNLCRIVDGYNINGAQ